MDNQTVEITKEQRSVMEHALGLNYKKKPYRNRYYTSSDNLQWLSLVSSGLAEQGGGWSEGMCYFRVTFAGAKAIFTKPMSRKYFDDLG